MAKFFSRLTQSKQKCTITFTLHSVESKVYNPTEMSIVLKRGETDEIAHFLAKQETPTYEVQQTIHRDANFFRDA